MATKVTDEGQVSDSEARPRTFRIGPGSEVAFRCTADGTVVLEKVEEAPPLDPDRFDKVVGILPPSPSTDEIMAMLRGEPE